MRRSLFFLFCLLFLAANRCMALGPGETAPDFRLTGIEGEEFTLSQIRGGKSLLLDFGSVFCPNCQQTLSALSEMARSYSGKGLSVAAINIDSPAAGNAVKSIALGMGLRYPVLLDTDGKAAEAYGVKQIPHVVLIDDKGIIRAVHSGSSTGLERLISSIFGPPKEGR